MPGRLRLIGAASVACVAWLAACEPRLSRGDPDSADWAYFGGDKAFTRYTPVDQITRDNVGDLKILWRRPAVDAALTASFPDLGVSGYLRATPILIDGVLYAPNGVGLAEAFDPETGETHWIQQPWPRTIEEARGRSSRGMDYWTDGSDRRLIHVRGGYLHALDPETGHARPDFGDGGRVDLVPPQARRFSWSSGPIVVNDVIVVAGTVDGAGDSGMRWRGSAPDNLRGYDVRTGELLWTFYVVPREGELGADTWGNESWRESGDLGAWCCLSADEELGFVFVPFSAPTAAYYGGHRPGDNLFSNSLVAIDVATGERVWHFQMVHHDLWEYDTVGPPTLGEIVVDGRRIQAVMQPYAFAHAIPRVYRIVQATDPTSEMEYWSPNREAPDIDGLPITKPPWGRSFRGYDKATGEVVWEIELDAGTTGGPMSYMHDGKQFIVVAIGGGQHPPEFITLGLP